jgi:hypothetical protein
VLLDCDGVLADFIGEVIETIVAHGGPRHTRADITEFNFTAALKLDADLARLVKRTISTEPGWWYGLDPFPEAIEGVAKLREVAEVYVVTSPWNSHPNWLHEREAWLKKHFDIPHSHVIACSGEAPRARRRVRRRQDRSAHRMGAAQPLEHRWDRRRGCDPVGDAAQPPGRVARLGVATVDARLDATHRLDCERPR